MGGRATKKTFSSASLRTNKKYTLQYVITSSHLLCLFVIDNSIQIKKKMNRAVNLSMLQLRLDLLNRGMRMLELFNQGWSESNHCTLPQVFSTLVDDVLRCEVPACSASHCPLGSCFLIGWTGTEALADWI